MEHIETKIPGVYILKPKVFTDARGFFLETYNTQILKQFGITCQFVQDNHSRSEGPVLRGLHYQVEQEQAKLIRVIQGEIYDVAVDIRHGSPTFGQWVAEYLSAENKHMFFIPKGFAHGFLVISPAAEVLYKASNFYAPSKERGIIWNDPNLNIDWPIKSPFLSIKDRAYSTLSNIPVGELPKWLR
jgi:dTDP-4-dehydrorhamnose 3,5-epimerase